MKTLSILAATALSLLAVQASAKDYGDVEDMRMRGAGARAQADYEMEKSGTANKSYDELAPAAGGTRQETSEIGTSHQKRSHVFDNKFEQMKN